MLDKLKINKKLLRELDIIVILLAILIVVFGALNIYSATKGINLCKRQLIWLVVGLVVVYLILTIDYHLIKNYTPLIYWSCVVLLLLNDFVLGKISKGARSWIKIGGVSIQPSEFAKIGMMLMLAKKIDDMDGKINEPKNLLTLLIYAGIPMVLIVIQPDMGMTMVCFFIVLGIFFVSGLDIKTIIGGLISLTLLIAITWNSGLIKPYQQQRLTSFLNPEADQLGANLQLTQSLIGIGSGGIFGKGFTQGTQTSLSFVPEAHTDFIFAVVGEEWGLVGSIVLLILYSILIFRLIKISRTAKDLFGSMLCIGIVSTFLFSLLQNIGMTIGIMPITGITLPLMSYGGSSILTSLIALGLALNVGMRRKKINF
ncbi:rod shape-determining protein RodA [Haloimpatiens sp. FM7330]|uniref:rod shape-determining protein RodA n=1 Tax=Haloimpatiens sp. FM7330 TaxID=3298610 RepID=UPI003637BFC4